MVKEGQVCQAAQGGVFQQPMVVQVDRRMVYVVDQDGQEFIFHIGRDGIQESKGEARREMCHAGCP